MYVDTHLHLCEPWLRDEDRITEENRKKVIADITQNKIVTWAQSVDIPTYEMTLAYSRQSEYIFPSFGILPWYAHEYSDKLDRVTEMCEDALMLGEIGLDEKYAQNKASVPHQRPLFEVFLEASEKHNLILNLHFRGDLEREGFEYLKSYDIKRAIFHSYSGSPDMIKEINDHGYYYSYGAANFSGRGNPRREGLAERIRLIPDDLLVLEIDVIQKSNFRLPSDVFREMLRAAAELRSTTTEEIEAINHRNVSRLVGHDPRLEQINKLLKI
jgi:Tat protein secretion system quality control protein TatD with DNase activity